MWEYRIKVLKVVDGATLDCRVDLGFKMWLAVRLCLVGVDVPKLDDPDPDQRILAEAARQFLERRLIGTESAVFARTQKNGSRWMAEILYGTEDMVESINRDLVLSGLAFRRGS